MLSFTLFGPITVTRDGEPIAQFRSQTELALLVYLAHTGRGHSRESIADLLWEARTSSQSLSNVRTVLADPRANHLLTKACAALMSQAEAIEGPKLRQSFLQHIPSHRSIMEAGAQSSHLTHPYQV